jgi:hypothetical protein
LFPSLRPYTTDSQRSAETTKLSFAWRAIKSSTLFSREGSSSPFSETYVVISLTLL